ncbi:kinase-like protein [Mollisia scopiformis]|uniref:Kinase-like protein n=1 Tax=Mollisia scopiformis TaxID=149040 RepID=A0A194X6K7_MOLSC|nr:kinase-like protein [Mollisia scopiformis]KUJ15719.1 kinase-like protein [Mollisia scopiformis]
MSYSNSGGGTLTLPSPTHPHHVDATAIARTIRRSLSRSPSKFRLVTKSPSSSPKSPLSPSPPKRHSSQPALSVSTPANAPHTPSPLAVPFPPSAKLALRSSTRTSKSAPPRPSSRTRTSPKSPMKRALSQTSDTGNSFPNSSQGSAGGQENSRSPVERKSFERVGKMETSGPLNYALSRLGGDGACDTPTGSSTSSPLKRSDAIMNLDQASLGSPVAKRRSLHGSASFGQDFNVFDHGPAPSSNFDIHDDSNHEYELSTASITSDNPLAFTSMPRRSSSLRKSTLQQRHGEKTSWGRRAAAQALAAQQLANSVPEVSTPVQTKNRPRLSLDQFMPPMPRDSPFSSQASLPNPSAHVMNPPAHQPHPLSRTMTTSSSSGSIADDSPTHVPVHFGEKTRPKIDFSKSMPVGALRPFAADLYSRDEETFATPQNYKNVKPHPAAFASTGLISKMNKNPEEPRVTRGKAVPDTPCKKQTNVFATYPAAPMPGSALVKARHVRHSFGTPSTPFNLHGNTPAQGTFGNGSSVFGGAFPGRGLTRRGSFLSIDGDELGGSPDAKGDSQSNGEYDLPPTPTKQALVQQQYSGSPSHHRSFPPSVSAVGLGLTKKAQRTSSKLNPFSNSSPIAETEEHDGSPDPYESPTVAHVRNQKSTDPAVPFSRLRNQPSPLERVDFFERLSPHTPQDNMVPPDPSGLTISNPRDGQAAKGASMPPPATPTAGRDQFSKIADRRLSTTPISNFAAADVDDALLSRFERVELVGSGEFSQVYRVTKIIPTTNPNQLFFPSSTTTPQSQSPASTLERVFAVKKTLQPYAGIRDRQRKLQEVNVLKALGKSDYVVSFLDNWEANNHLYIQTEYCEEGSLDLFLERGLQHIHDSGFIHLDLKPANILITFEGVLKIADFGLACTWPAPPNHDGEGDREYIAPEILKGILDKPADIFSFGMIMVEIAGNVALPENGPSWAKLRSGDPSDAPSLTWISESVLPRDATGMVIDEGDSMDTTFSDDFDVSFGSPTLSSRRRNAGSKTHSHDPANLFGTLRRGELHKAPAFMKNSQHEWSMDNLVRAMLQPVPGMRPNVGQILAAGGLQWVEPRRRAGATVFEGDWGPADELLADDAEMMDV